MDDSGELDKGIDRAVFERMRKAAEDMLNAGKDPTEGIDILRRFHDKSVTMAQDLAHDKSDP